MKKVLIIALIVAIPSLIEAQHHKTATTKKTTAKPAATPAPSPEASPDPVAPAIKKNGRPADDSTTNSVATASTKYKPVYVYTFERPGFEYSSIRIEHDEDGRGRIWFKRDKETETYDDPLELSPATLTAVRKAFADLNFLDSTETYQYSAHDYSNMGNLTITLNRGGRTRTAKFNWTEVKPAKLLMDTYRAVGNEAIWKFEMTLARENQPLLTPGLADAIDDLIRRGDISDPPHILPYITDLSNDERLPLIARNHFKRLVGQITKVKK
ncbi:MAG: hypothetical protein JO314_00820 [Acidobacteria bacterium]|nr:hypothetical protein [Acidobacteriota bacterium]